MTEQQLDGTYIRAALEQVNGKGVTQGMRSNRLGNTATETSVPASPLDYVGADVLARLIAGEEPGLWSFHTPPLAQDI